MTWTIILGLVALVLIVTGLAFAQHFENRPGENSLEVGAGYIMVYIGGGAGGLAGIGWIVS